MFRPEILRPCYEISVGLETIMRFPSPDGVKGGAE